MHQKAFHTKEKAEDEMKNALYVDCLPIIHHWVKEESRIQQEKMAPFKNQHKMREHKKDFYRYYGTCSVLA